MTVTRFPFRYRDPLSGHLIVARYKAAREETAARYAEWEIIGPLELREPDGSGRRFDPHRVRHDSAPQLDPVLDADERFLVLLFLRRYITYCARRRHLAAMLGAAKLAREITDR